MKLLHKQLLVVCLPYLALLAGVWLIHAWLVAPTISMQYHRQTAADLRLHAAHIKTILGRAKAQLHRMADLPAFRTGNAEQILDELKMRNPRQEGFEGILFEDRQQKLHGAKGTSAGLALPRPERDDLAAGRDVVSDVRPSVVSAKQVVLVIVPVSDEQGEIVGSLVGELPASEVMPDADASSSKTSKLLTLQIGRQTLSSAKGGSVSSAALPVGAPMAYVDPRDRSRGAWEAEAVTISPEGWTLASSILSRELHAPTRWLCNGVLALATVCLVVTAGGIVWQHRSLTRRHTVLTEIIQRFGASDQTVRSDERANDELGRLAEAFNCMADDVQHALKKLRKELAEHQQSPGQWKEQVASLEARLANLERYDAVVAHEFKGPLATLKSYAGGLEGLAKNGHWDQFQHDLDRVQRICQQLCDASDALLRLAAAEPGRRIEEPVPLEQAARKAQALLQADIEARRIAVSLAEDLPTVVGDPVLWRQVFQNLLQNAVKACENRDSAQINIGRKSQNGNVVCFVRDNGAGIPAERLAHLFDGVATPCGTGIGLTLVKRIVGLHGGKIWAESEGQGTGTTICWTVDGP